MKIRRNKTIDVTTVFLSCCLCVAPMLQAIDTAAASGSAVANSFLLPTGTACKTIGTLQQPQVQASTPPQVVYLIPQQPAPQPVPTRSFGTSVGNFICENPKLVLTLTAATASTIGIAINAWRTGALERLVRRNHTDVTNMLGALNKTAAETGKDVAKLQKTVGENHTAAMGGITKVQTTADNIQTEVREVRTEIGQRFGALDIILKTNGCRLQKIEGQQDSLLEFAQKAERNQQEAIRVANAAMMQVGHLSSEVDGLRKEVRGLRTDMKIVLDGQAELTSLVRTGLDSMKNQSSSSRRLPGVSNFPRAQKPISTLSSEALTPAVDLTTD